MAATGSPKRDILLLYNGLDAESWKEYFLALVKVGLTDITYETVDINSDQSEMLMKHVDKFHLLVVLVSPKMMDILELESESVKQLINAYKHVAVIRLCVEQTDLDHVVKNEYMNTESWTVTEISSVENDNQKMIAVLMDRLQLARRPRTPPVVQPKPAPRKYSGTKQPKTTEESTSNMSKDETTTTKPKSTSTSTIVHTFSPEQIKTIGEPVLIVFKKQFDHETIQVAFDNADDTKVDTKRLNSYCYQFKAPVHKPGRMTVYIFIDGEKRSKFTIKYSTPSIFAYTCPEYLSQVLDVQLEDLDKTLAQIFQSSTPDDDSLRYILSPKNVPGSDDGKRTDDILPTLVHFACYYGLQELCSCVIDMPGSQSAFRILNCQDKTPLDLARDNNHQDLAEYIETFLEMQDYISVCEDVYEKMTNQSLEEGYMYMKGGNRDMVEPYDEGRVPGYMYMKGGNRDMVEPYPYDEGRVPGDYVLTDNISRGRDSVTEVTEDEDVLAEPKPRVPDRNTKPKTHTEPQSGPKRPIPPPPTTLQQQQQQQQSFEDLPLPQDDIFFGSPPLHPAAMGSQSVAELIDLQDAYKQGYFNPNDIERLYEAWMERNKSGQTASLKQRKARLEEMKKEYNCKPLKQKSQKFGFISRLTTKKSKTPDVPELDIKHPVVENNYASWQPPPMLEDQYGRRDSYGSNRDSVSSTTSSSSGGSRDSGLDPIRERSDSEPDEVAPPVPRRPRDNSLQKSRNRDSLGEEFLNNIQQGRTSRLPPVPPLKPPIRKVKSDAKPNKPLEKRKVSR